MSKKKNPLDQKNKKFHEMFQIFHDTEISFFLRKLFSTVTHFLAQKRFFFHEHLWQKIWIVLVS